MERYRERREEGISSLKKNKRGAEAFVKAFLPEGMAPRREHLHSVEGGLAIDDDSPIGDNGAIGIDNGVANDGANGSGYIGMSDGPIVAIGDDGSGSSIPRRVEKGF